MEYLEVRIALVGTVKWYSESTQRNLLSLKYTEKIY